MRRAITFTVLVLAGCSSERVQQIGSHQYMVPAKGERGYAQATETCDKQGRKWIALAIPPGSPAGQFRFECINSYEIVPASQDTYKIRVFIPDIPVKHVIIPASQGKPADTEWVLNEEPADKEARQRATEYCGTMHKSLRITNKAFDTSTGLDIAFECVPQGTAAP